MFIPPPIGAPGVGNPVGSQLFAPQPFLGQDQPSPPSEDIKPPEADFDRSINYLADYSGCGFWRMIWPEHMLNAHQKAVIHSTTLMCLDERWYINTRCVRLQRQATEQQLQFLGLLRQFSSKHGFHIVYEIDDIVFHEDIPDYNKFKAAFTDPKIRECAMTIMQNCDEITVTNKFMQEYYRAKTGNQNITVIPNFPPKWWMGQYYNEDKISKNFQQFKKRPRVAYCASGAHFDVENRVKQRDDFHHVIPAIRKSVDDIHWVFIGAFPLGLQDLVAAGKIEFHQWRRLYEYPALLDEINVNMLIAPLQDNVFNKAKSDLKHIEACCYGLPIACQDLCTYEDAPIKFRTGDDLVDQVKHTLKHHGKYMETSKAARAVANGRWLESEKNIDMYQELYKYPYHHEKRTRLHSLEVNK
jgi:glycosyltransferase involved in cell wall biosynthesis